MKVVAKEKAASDPYSIINYGIGGQIEVKTTSTLKCKHNNFRCTLTIGEKKISVKVGSQLKILSLDININNCIHFPS